MGTLGVHKMGTQSAIVPVRISRQNRDEGTKIYPEVFSDSSGPNENGSAGVNSSRLQSESSKGAFNNVDVKYGDYVFADGSRAAEALSHIAAPTSYAVDAAYVMESDRPKMAIDKALGITSRAPYAKEGRPGNAERKFAVEYSFDEVPTDMTRQKDTVVTHPMAIDSIYGGQCISTFYTVVAMCSMFVALLIPALFHVCCQFRLYGSIAHVTQGMGDLADPQSHAWIIMERLREFENFFIFGVALYISIQIGGFFATQSRINRYLLRLCYISVEKAKHDFLYVSKQRVMERFADYAKQVYGDHSNAYLQTEQNLVKAFDDASLKFDHFQVDEVWNQISFLRYRMLLLKIYLPLLINILLSIGTSAIIYDRRFRMHHKVPLAHPDIVSNLYWYAAIQYEGFWCIFTVFVLNIVTWLYLCHINRHNTLFRSLEEAEDVIQKVSLEYGATLAKGIWDEQMLLFSSTMYAIKSNKVQRNFTYTPVRLETFNSQINLNRSGNNSSRQCLCNCLCAPTIEEVKSQTASVIGPSPLEGLYSPLLGSEIQDGFRKVGRTL